MTRFSSRPYAGDSDLALLIDFSRAATIARLPGLTYVQPGDIAWRIFTPNFDPTKYVQLWFDDRGLAAYAFFEPPLNFEFDIRADAEHDTLLADILAWAEARRVSLLRPGGVALPRAYAMLGQDTLCSVSLDSDAWRIAALERAGYAKVERHSVRYRRSLDTPIPEVELPPGMRLRHATDADLDARIELHRDAWSVWGQSSQDVATYRRLRAHAPYDETLDIVLEDADGRLVSYCIAWADPATGIGVFEPVGTRPGVIGRGFARAVVCEGLRRLRDRGLHTALIGTASVNERALRVYPACGFELVENEHFYVKKVSE